MVEHFGNLYRTIFLPFSLLFMTSFFPALFFFLLYFYRILRITVVLQSYRLVTASIFNPVLFLINFNGDMDCILFDYHLLILSVPFVPEQ